MDCNVTWSAPFWDELYSRKHRKPSKRSRQMWDRSILAASTQGEGEDAVYDPNLTARDIEQIEMDCVRNALSALGRAPGELRLDICHVRRFYVRLGNIIGASEGIKTDYILVQYENNGSVHGRPVTAAYLRSRGAPL